MSFKLLVPNFSAVVNNTAKSHIVDSIEPPNGPGSPIAFLASNGVEITSPPLREKCTTVQEISIFPEFETVSISVTKNVSLILVSTEVFELAHRCGYNGLSDFFAHYNSDFHGYLINWTDDYLGYDMHDNGEILNESFKERIQRMRRKFHLN